LRVQVLPDALATIVAAIAVIFAALAATVAASGDFCRLYL